MKLLFKIEKITPERMPGAELAAYMVALARFLGAREHVHFTAIRAESTGIEAHVGIKARHAVRQRMREAESLSSPAELKRHRDEINELLSRRKTSAKLQELRNDGKRVDRVYFVGADVGRPELSGIREHVQVQGILYRIEGLDESVHVGLVDGETRYSVVLSRDQAKDIARTSMFSLVRVEGSALMAREANGGWLIGEIDATTIAPLGDVPLEETLEELRGAGGFGWSHEGGLDALEEIRGTG